MNANEISDLDEDIVEDNFRSNYQTKSGDMIKIRLVSESTNDNMGKSTAMLTSPLHSLLNTNS
mgnify:CR=1 FL=1